jgi:proteasome accessory factor B
MERLERLMNLVGLLADSPRLLTFDELIESIPGYSDDRDTAHRLFERDKVTLREIGLPLEIEGLDALGGSEQGYRIVAGKSGTLELSTAELAALHAAVSAVRIEGSHGDEALLGIGGLVGPGAEAVGMLPDAGPLTVILDGARRNRRVEFGYRGERRRLEPWGIVFRWGRWYAHGLDPDRGETRTFRADRFEEPIVLTTDRAANPPEHFELREVLAGAPWELGDGQPTTARLVVDAPRAADAISAAGEERVVERRDDGSVLLEVEVTNRHAFRGWVLDFLDAAEILEPAELRDDLVQWLETMAR